MNCSDPAEILRQLIRCRSITPMDAGALDLLQSLIAPLGFSVERRIFSDSGTPDVENLYGRLGKSGRHIMFAGHCDVVPPGDEAQWSYPPFAAETADGNVFGRGAVDMKGAIACFIAAVARLQPKSGISAGSISLLITGDEEGPAINGTDKMLRWAAEAGERWDGAIVGEPTNRSEMGDVVKIGRRGSLSGRVCVVGKQGHVAYPHLADNPINGLMDLVEALLFPALDEGSKNFEPTGLAITSVDVGNKTVNVIPHAAVAQFNVRFNDLWTGARMQREILRRLEVGAASGRFRQGGGEPVRYSVEWLPGIHESFLTRDNDLIAMISRAVQSVTGRKPQLTTGGGTSDARFIRNYCPVVEFGLVGQTMHQIDERVPVGDLETLTAVYERFLESWFKAA